MTVPGSEWPAKMDTVSVLSTVPLFACLDDSEIEALGQAMVSRHAPRNTVVLSEGDDTTSLYFIRSGRVRVTRTNEEGREVVIATLGEGDYFGEMALVDELPRSATVVTKTDCEFWVFRRTDFHRMLVDVPSLSINLLKGMSNRLRSANSSIESLALLDVYGRVARLLMEMAEPHDDEWIVNESLTHQEIANMIGSSREMVSRILKDLSTGGYISTQKKRIVIKNRLPHAW